MLKKTIEYEDYNGIKRTEDFYFNLTKAELLEMELSTTGGMETLLKRIVKESDSAKLTALFKELILKAYGEKSDDGRRFVKNKELREAFEQTEAYSELFTELATNADEAIKFVKGIIPANLAAEVDKVDTSAIPRL